MIQSVFPNSTAYKRCDPWISESYTCIALNTLLKDNIPSIEEMILYAPKNE